MKGAHCLRKRPVVQTGRKDALRNKWITSIHVHLHSFIFARNKHVSWSRNPTSNNLLTKHRHLFLKTTIVQKIMELSLEQAGVCAHMPLFLTIEQLIAVPLAFPAARPRTWETCYVCIRATTQLESERYTGANCNLLDSRGMSAQHRKWIGSRPSKQTNYWTKKHDHECAYNAAFIFCQQNVNYWKVNKQPLLKNRTRIFLSMRLSNAASISSMARLLGSIDKSAAFRKCSCSIKL